VLVGVFGFVMAVEMAVWELYRIHSSKKANVDYYLYTYKLEEAAADLIFDGFSSLPTAKKTNQNLEKKFKFTISRSHYPLA
jgi:hypothetical protein